MDHTTHTKINDISFMPNLVGQDVMIIVTITW